MKIGILTLHSAPNVGAFLQCHSLVTTIKALGHNVEVINYLPPPQPSPSSLEHIFRLRGYIRHPLNALTALRNHTLCSIHTRVSRTDLSSLPLSPPLYHPRTIADLKYDLIVLGSDEIWNIHNPSTGPNLVYFGETGTDCKLCAYAPSFGSVTDVSLLTPDIKAALKKIDRLSGRDPNTVALLRAIGLNAPQVLDPTLLGAHIPTNSPLDGRHLLIYGRHLTPQELLPLMHFAQRRTLTLCSAIYPQHPSLTHYANVTASRFRLLIGSAAAVVTTTFHGVIFSILSGKPFAVLSPGSKREKIQGLLDTFGEADRLVTDLHHLPDILATPLNVSRLNQRLEAASTTSMRYLKDSLA